jgi:AcrR family transcriptional regulator
VIVTYKLDYQFPSVNDSILIAMQKTSIRKRKRGRPLSFDRGDALQKAMLAFWRHGYETTSISDLTQAMGVSAPSIYTAFGDKRRLFLEAMNRYAGSSEDLETILNQSATAYEAVFQMLMSTADTFTNDANPRGCLLASATSSGSAESMDVQAAVADVRHRMEGLVRVRIEQDVDAGILPPDTEAFSLALLVIALIQGMSVLARDGQTGEVLQAMIKAAMGAWPALHDGT